MKLLQHCRTALPGLLLLLVHPGYSSLFQAIPHRSVPHDGCGRAVLHQAKPVLGLASSTAPWILTLISYDEFLRSQELFQILNTQILVLCASRKEQGKEHVSEECFLDMA